MNVFDKEVLQGKMTSIGVPLPFSLGGAPVRLNLTDFAFVLLVNGLKIPKGKGIFTLLAKIGLKKLGEGKQWIDPPEWGYPSAARTSAGSLSSGESAMPMISGGLTHT